MVCPDSVNLNQQIMLLYLHKISNICFSPFSASCPASPLLYLIKQTFAPSLQFFGFPASFANPPEFGLAGGMSLFSVRMRFPARNSSTSEG